MLILKFLLSYSIYFLFNGKQKYSLWEAIKLMENKNIYYEKLYNININWKYLVVKLVDSTL